MGLTDRLSRAFRLAGVLGRILGRLSLRGLGLRGLGLRLVGFLLIRLGFAGLCFFGFGFARLLLGLRCLRLFQAVGIGAVERAARAARR